MTFARVMIIGVLLLVIVIAWLLFELHLDRKSRRTYRATVPGPRERLPAKSDL